MSKLKPDDARQGRKGTQVLIILVVGLVLCIGLFVVFAGSGLFGSSDNLSNDDNSQELSSPAHTGAESNDTLVSPSAPPANDQ